VGEGPPLEEKTSTAYGIDRDSIADALAERCPARLSSQRLRWLEVCPMKKSHARHAPN